MIKLDKPISMDRILKSENLAEVLSDNDLDVIGSSVCEGYRIDKDSRIEWEDNITEWTDLALQVAEDKMFPWPGAANVKYPLITTAALQFSARAYPSLLPGTNPVRGRVIGYDPTGIKWERADRVGKHMSYQILEQMEDWEEEMDKLLFSLPIVGCIFKKTYFDAILQRNVSEVIFPKELVVNYWSKNLETSERITHVLKMTENDIHERVVGGVFIDQTWEKVIDQLQPKDTDEALGQEIQKTDDETLPYFFIEQCCYLDLDGDGYREPYIVTVDLGSEKVARIVARFEDKDIQRNEKNEIFKIKPLNFYTKFSFIPSPDGGFYDIGFGVLLGPINDTINTLINQLLDSGALSNMQAGFISKGIRIKGGNTQFQLGEWKYVNTVGDDLRKGVFPLPVREPSQVLFSLLGMMVTSGEKLSSVTEVMTGEIPGQNTKATVAMAAIEQGMKVFSSIYKRIHRSLGKEYKKLFKLNELYLDEQEYFTVLDVGQEKQSSIGRSDYNSQDVDVVPASDPNVATEQQRLAKVEALLQILSLGTVNPQEVTKRYLEATEQPNIDVLMQVPPRGPDPQIEFEKMKFQAEMDLKMKELELKQTEIWSNAVKNIAQAETMDKTQDNQVQQYAAALDATIKAHQAQQEFTRQQEMHNQKLMQQDQLHQQKLAQQEQLAQSAGGSNGDNQGGLQ